MTQQQRPQSTTVKCMSDEEEENFSISPQKSFYTSRVVSTGKFDDSSAVTAHGLRNVRSIPADVHRLLI